MYFLWIFYYIYIYYYLIVGYLYVILGCICLVDLRIVRVILICLIFGRFLLFIGRFLRYMGLVLEVVKEYIYIIGLV